MIIMVTKDWYPENFPAIESQVRRLAFWKLDTKGGPDAKCQTKAPGTGPSTLIIQLWSKLMFEMHYKIRYITLPYHSAVPMPMLYMP